jgi:mannose-6-phosphate isomerase-like protein (cupin superfamily)
MVRGWFIGDFTPSVVTSEEFEVAIQKYSAGDKEPLHHHKVAVEVTVILNGSARMFDKIWSDGDIITIEPGEATAFEALTEVTTVVVKFPSASRDKYLGYPPVC